MGDRLMPYAVNLGNLSMTTVDHSVFNWREKDYYNMMNFGGVAHKESERA